MDRASDYWTTEEETRGLLLLLVKKKIQLLLENHDEEQLQIPLSEETQPYCSFHRPQWQIFLPFHIPEDGIG